MNIIAPAKLNLSLEVLGRRPDGYHEIRSIMQTVSLCDRLAFKHAPDTIFACNLSGWDASRSLVSRAVNLVRELTGCDSGVRIDMEKRIPLVAGLGGDSSDAAAALKGLDRLWKLGLTEAELLRLAARLGSDVPFFIYGGAALAGGRGEVLTPLLPFPTFYSVAVIPAIPPMPDKTRRLYSALKPEHFTGGQITADMAGVIRAGGEITALKLFNVFEQVAFDIFPGLNDCRERMLVLGADNIQLCGSGPALFTLTGNQKRASELAARFKGEGMEAYAAKSLV